MYTREKKHSNLSPARLSMTGKKNVFKKIVKWTGMVLALLVVLLLLGTWLINRAPLQKQIREAIVSRTGDMVSFGHLNIDLLPRPHLIVSGATITVPDRVAGSVASVAVYPELLPLIRGDVRIAQVRLKRPDFSVQLAEEEKPREQQGAQAAFDETRGNVEAALGSIREIAPRLYLIVNSGTLDVRHDAEPITTIRNINGRVAVRDKGFHVAVKAEALRWGPVSMKTALNVEKRGLGVRNLSISGGSSSISRLTGRFSWEKNFDLEISSGQAVVSLGDIFDRRNLLGSLQVLLKRVREMSGTVRFEQMQFSGPLLNLKKATMKMEGSVEKVVVDTAALPGPFRAEQGRFSATMKMISFTDVRASAMDGSITGSVLLGGRPGRIRSVDLHLNGALGSDTVHWVWKRFRLPEQLQLRTPLRLSAARIHWRRGPRVSAAGTAIIRKGPSLSLDLQWSPGSLEIKRVVLRGGKAPAMLTLSKTKNVLDLAFKGRLSEEMISRAFEKTPSFQNGRLQGDFQARVLLDRPAESTARGVLEGVNVLVPYKTGRPVMFRHFIVKANRKAVSIEKASLLWGTTPLELEGRISAATEGFRVNMGVTAGIVDIGTIQRAIAKRRNEAGADEKTRPGDTAAGPPLRGNIRFAAKGLVVGAYTISPIKGEVSLKREQVRVTFTEGTLCGISVTGYLERADPGIKLVLLPKAVQQPLEPALRCLPGDVRISGTYSLQADLEIEGKSENLFRHMNGPVVFTANDGRIYRYRLLARIFAFLNVTELLRGKMPDLGRKGFQYKKVTIKGDIKNGKLRLEQATLEGATLNIAAEGEIDFGGNKIDVTVLVAPFKTLEYIISKIPIIRNILGGRLVTIPVRVRGNLHNPNITPLDPKSIGENLLKIMRKILELPFRVLDPFLGRSKR